jgi:hypothetical protein
MAREPSWGGELVNFRRDYGLDPADSGPVSIPVLHHGPVHQEPAPEEAQSAEPAVLAGLAADTAGLSAMRCRPGAPTPIPSDSRATLAELHAAHSGLELTPSAARSRQQNS